MSRFRRAFVSRVARTSERAAFAFLALLLAAAPRSATADVAVDGAPAAPAATYPEVPYYLGKLQETQLEGDRMRLNKVIHDAIVTADVSEKKVVREMDPIIAKVEAAIAAGLDRTYLEGQSSWLQSAVDFYRRERLRPVVDISEMDWAPPQMAAAKSGPRISTYPDHVLIHDAGKTKTVSESSNIHEAVISPDGQRVAYFRTSDDGSRAEIWVVDTRKFRRKKVAAVKSCLTLLFTPDSRRILFQEVPEGPDAESPVYSVGIGGGKAKAIARVRLLQTTVEHGKFAGNIIVYKAVVHHLGTTVRDCAFVISPSGKEIGRLKDGPCR